MEAKLDTRAASKSPAFFWKFDRNKETQSPRNGLDIHTVSSVFPWTGFVGRTHAAVSIPSNRFAIESNY